MKTKLISYRFNIDNDDEKRAYNALVDKLKSQGLKCHESWGGGSHYHGVSGNVELSTDYLFHNQWDTTEDSATLPNHRVFDWAQDYHSRDIGKNPSIKMGHYLVQTDEMTTIRRETLKCGYCGKMEHISAGYKFCPHCLNSEYLTKERLHLLRLMPVSFNGDRTSLNDSELEYILPLYIAAQTKTNDAKKIKRIADIKRKANKTIESATTERDGLVWLEENGINTGNCIYYSHKNVFSFGWREPVCEEVKNAILNVISEFPFAYEIKCNDGKTLEGY